MASRVHVLVGRISSSRLTHRSSKREDCRRGQQRLREVSKVSNNRALQSPFHQRHLLRLVQHTEIYIRSRDDYCDASIRVMRGSPLCTGPPFALRIARYSTLVHCMKERRKGMPHLGSLRLGSAKSARELPYGISPTGRSDRIPLSWTLQWSYGKSG